MESHSTTTDKIIMSKGGGKKRPKNKTCRNWQLKRALLGLLLLLLFWIGNVKRFAPLQNNNQHKQSNEKDATFLAPLPIVGNVQNSTSSSSSSSKGSIITGFANDGYKDIAWKWYQELEKLGYEEHLVVAHDQSSAAYFQEKGMRYDTIYASTTNDAYSYSLNGGTNCTEYMNQFNTPGKKKQTYRRSLFGSRWSYILRKLEEGYDILTTDVDNVYTRYVSLSFMEDSPYDAYHAYAGTLDAFPRTIFRRQGFTICGGMSWLRSTPGVIDFVRAIAHRCGCEVQPTCSCHCDDQVVINSLIYDGAYKITWDGNGNDPGTAGMPIVPKTLEELSWEGKTGICNKTGHRVKIWDRHMMYRAPFDPNTCPNENNWIAMPIGLDRAFVWDLWREGCGRNNINSTILLNHTQ